MSITSTRGKLEVLQKHYQLLSKMSVDSEFDADWKEEVEDSVGGYSSLSEEAGDAFLERTKKIFLNEQKVGCCKKEQIQE